jgi:uncharacterized membrane protein
MFFLAFLLSVLTNYVVLSDIQQETKTFYYIAASVVAILVIITKILG